MSLKNELYNDQPFVIIIDRSNTYRRYVLITIEKDGSHKPQNEPLYFEEFRILYGFKEEWPHESI